MGRGAGLNARGKTKCVFCSPSASPAALLGFACRTRAAMITGDISFDGSNTFDEATHTVTFIGAQNAQNDAGSDFSLFGTCDGCITFKNLTSYSPFSPVADEISGSNNGLSLAIDLTGITSVTAQPEFLDIAGTALLHLTGFDAARRRKILLQHAGTGRA